MAPVIDPVCVACFDRDPVRVVEQDSRCHGAVGLSLRIAPRDATTRVGNPISLQFRMASALVSGTTGRLGP